VRRPFLAFLGQIANPGRFSQRRTQIGNITKTITPAGHHYLETPGLTIDPGLNQTHYSFPQ
jgi:hypothetical protein